MSIARMSTIQINDALFDLHDALAYNKEGKKSEKFQTEADFSPLLNSYKFAAVVIMFDFKFVPNYPDDEAKKKACKFIRSFRENCHNIIPVNFSHIFAIQYDEKIDNAKIKEAISTIIDLTTDNPKSLYELLVPHILDTMPKIEPDLQRVVPVVSAALPNSILIADAPLSAPHTIIKKSIEDFNRLIAAKRNLLFPTRYTWVETPVLPLRIKQNYEMAIEKLNIKADNTTTLAAFYENSNKPELVLCDMKEFGFGVFTNSFIPKGTTVAILAGELLPYTGPVPKFHHPFTATCRSYSPLFAPLTIKENSHSIKQGENACTINTTIYGNYAGFLQHMFHRNQLLTLGVADKNVATANLTLDSGTYGNYPHSYCVATRDIKKNEQLAISYGVRYWKAKGINPTLFDLQGKQSEIKINLFSAGTYERMRLSTKLGSPVSFLPLKDLSSQYSPRTEHIISFLNFKDLQSLSSTNKHNYEIVKIFRKRCPYHHW